MEENCLLLGADLGRRGGAEGPQPPGNGLTRFSLAPGLDYSLSEYTPNSGVGFTVTKDFQCCFWRVRPGVSQGHLLWLHFHG